MDKESSCVFCVVSFLFVWNKKKKKHNAILIGEAEQIRLQKLFDCVPKMVGKSEMDDSMITDGNNINNNNIDNNNIDNNNIDNNNIDNNSALRSSIDDANMLLTMIGDDNNDNNDNDNTNATVNANVNANANANANVNANPPVNANVTDKEITVWEALDKQMQELMTGAVEEEDEEAESEDEGLEVGEFKYKQIVHDINRIAIGGWIPSRVKRCAKLRSRAQDIGGWVCFFFSFFFFKKNKSKSVFVCVFPCFFCLFFFLKKNKTYVCVCVCGPCIFLEQKKKKKTV